MNGEYWTLDRPLAGYPGVVASILPKTTLTRKAIDHINHFDIKS